MRRSNIRQGRFRRAGYALRNVARLHACRNAHELQTCVWRRKRRAVGRLTQSKRVEGAFARVASHRLATPRKSCPAEQRLQLFLGFPEYAFARVSELLAAAVDIEVQHRHR